MKRLLMILSALLVTVQMAWAQEQTEPKVHYLAIHVDSADPKTQNIALNNAVNVTNYYEAKGEKVVIELVAYGPGLTMFIPGKSPVEDRIKTMALEFENLTFAACGNTKKKMEKKLGGPIQIMEEAPIVPSGVVRLMELQEQGYAYVRP